MIMLKILNLFICLQTNPNCRAYEKKLLLIIYVACVIWDVFPEFGLSCRW